MSTLVWLGVGFVGSFIAGCITDRLFVLIERRLELNNQLSRGVQIAPQATNSFMPLNHGAIGLLVDDESGQFDMNNAIHKTVGGHVIKINHYAGLSHKQVSFENLQIGQFVGISKNCQTLQCSANLFDSANSDGDDE